MNGLNNMNGVNGLGDLHGNQPLNRMISLGNIHPETTTEDSCNATRGVRAAEHQVHAGQAYRGTFPPYL